MTPDITIDNAYQMVMLLIQEFEEAALQSNTRAGFLAVSNGATYAADLVLDAQDKSLNRVANERSKLRKPATDQSQVNASASASQETTQPENSNLPLVDIDADFSELFGGSDSPFANYLEECLGCSLRLKFDWQLKPMNLLGPINSFLDNLSAQLDRLLARLDPFKSLQDICWALNHLKTLCPPDLILLIAALKALMKKYLLQLFNVRLDWTTLLGPLLKAIIEAISDLFDNIFSLLMAPLDCVVAGLRTSNDLLRASESFVHTVRSAGAQVGNFFSSIEANGVQDTVLNSQNSGLITKDVSWSQPDPNLKADPLAYFNTGTGTNQGYDPGRLEVQTSLTPFGEEPESPDEGFQIPTGFQLTSNTTMASAMQDPNFALSSTFLEKIIIPIQEVIAWIRETYQKFMGALTSLSSLVGGSLSLSFENIGILLFILDIISLIMLIYKLLTSNLGVKDWCSFLQEHPEVLENELRNRYGSRISVESAEISNEQGLIIRQGPVIAGTIKTCVNERTSSEKNLIDSWIREIEMRGAS